MKISSIIFVVLVLAGTSYSNAQNIEITPDSGLALSISANGTCWNDCWVATTPIGDGTIVAILKGGSVVDQGFLEVPLEVSNDDAPPPPSDGTGSRSRSFDAFGRNNKGQWGTFVTTITYTYVDFVLRDQKAETTFTPLDPPPGDGEGGGDEASKGGSGG